MAAIRGMTAASAILRAVIVDDEPLSRRALRQLLDRCGDVRVVAECTDADEARRAVSDADVIFLDVEMPGESGLQLAATLSKESAIAIVFVTAYERYALPAFDVDAVDYLAKPVEPARLARALARVREWRGESSQQRIAVRVGARDVMVPIEEVTAIEADGVYAAIHAGKRLLVRRSLADFEATLGPGFVRVHRSWLVRRSSVREIVYDEEGAGACVRLVTGLRVPISRRRRAAIVADLTGDRRPAG